MFVELRELLRSGAIRRHQLGAKYLLAPNIFSITLPQKIAITLFLFYSLLYLQSERIGLFHVILYTILYLCILRFVFFPFGRRNRISLF